MPDVLAKDMVIVPVRLPHHFVDELDACAKQRGYASRTEFIRESLRRSVHEPHYRELAEALKAAQESYRKLTPRQPIDLSPGWKRKMWAEERKKALKKAGGDRKKAERILMEEEEKAAKALLSL